MRIKLLSLFLLLSVMSFAQVQNDGGLSFIGLQHNFAGNILNYRKASIEGNAGDAKDDKGNDQKEDCVSVH